MFAPITVHDSLRTYPMKRHIITTIVAAAGLALSAGTMADTMSKQAYKTSVDRIESAYKSDKKKCDSLSGNANDICVTEAAGKEKVAKANLDAANKNTNEARYDARVAKAEADYSVAMEKCDDQSGNKKDVCVKEAKAAEIAAKADAEAQMKSSKAKTIANDKSADARKDANEKSADARHDAAVDKQDANYSVALKRCDSLDGNAKKTCVNDAKALFGK